MNILHHQTINLDRFANLPFVMMPLVLHSYPISATLVDERLVIGTIVFDAPSDGEPSLSVDLYLLDNDDPIPDRAQCIGTCIHEGRLKHVFAVW